MNNSSSERKKKISKSFIGRNRWKMNLSTFFVLFFFFSAEGRDRGRARRNSRRQILQSGQHDRIEVCGQQYTAAYRIRHVAARIPHAELRHHSRRNQVSHPISTCDLMARKLISPKPADAPGVISGFLGIIGGIEVEIMPRVEIQSRWIREDLWVCSILLRNRR